MPTIYEQLGAESGIRELVDDFFRRVLTDPDLDHYFADVDLSAVKWHLAALLVTVTGGPSIYEGRDLAEAHAHLGITTEDFERVVEHLVWVLEAARLPAESVNWVVGALAAY